jgi:hypothetical protein
MQVPPTQSKPVQQSLFRLHCPPTLLQSPTVPPPVKSLHPELAGATLTTRRRNAAVSSFLPFRTISAIIHISAYLGRCTALSANEAAP